MLTYTLVVADVTADKLNTDPALLFRTNSPSNVIDSTMPRYVESNACNACARSKRKCGRQMPACTRCADRAISCVYPSSTNRAFSASRQLLSNGSRGSVAREENGLASVALATSPGAANLILPDELMLDLTFPLLDRDFTAPLAFVEQPSMPTTRQDWFLAPDTWKISQLKNTSVAESTSLATIKQYVKLLQSWFERWASTGSNPFIHARLYTANFPACVQVAHATMASYIHRTPANSDIIFQVVEDRSNDLLQENGAVLDTFDDEKWTDREEQDVDLFAQLARLHALTVYQLIGLFDGDIRSRYVAEGQMAVRESWAAKLLESAAKTLSNTHAQATDLVAGSPWSSSYSQHQWYLWILSESVRRTYLVASSISCIFSALQKRWSTCVGGIMFTNRQGLWDATNAIEWEKQCLRGNVAFLQRFECASFFEDAKPADIDEFGTAMMDMTFDRDLLGEWRNKYADGAQGDSAILLRAR